MIPSNNLNPAKYLPYAIVPGSNLSPPAHNPAQALQIPDHWGIGSQHIKNYFATQINRKEPTDYFLWITDPAIKEAVNILQEIQFPPEDIAYMKKLGIRVIFNNGREALDVIAKKGIHIEFGALPDPDAHSEWILGKNTILINEMYRGTKDPAIILAISEALMHELGHAKDNDSLSSIKEELDCLAMNTLAHRFHVRKYPHIFDNATAKIITEGVDLYTNLFFDPDPQKKALRKRVFEVYGDLPLRSPHHSRITANYLQDNPTAAQAS